MQFKSSDFFYLNLKKLNRLAPFPATVSVVGVNACSKKTIKKRAEYISFTFILEGSGWLQQNDKLIEVIAPCVFLHYPDDLIHHWPNGEWTEFYISFLKTSIDYLEKANLSLPGKTFNKLISIATILPQISTIRSFSRLSNWASKPGVADQIDRLCENIIFESWFQKLFTKNSNEENAIRNIQHYIIEHFLEAIQFETIAAEHNLSYVNFRHLWKKYVKTPPSHFLMELRLKHSVELLSGTSMSISEISDYLGFKDKFYFFKKFKKFAGITASEYRKTLRDIQH